MAGKRKGNPKAITFLGTSPTEVYWRCYGKYIISPDPLKPLKFTTFKIAEITIPYIIKVQ